GPFAFTLDHQRLSTFSRYAVACGCVRSTCDHLREAIRETFDVEVTDANWLHWNGGVFVFSEGAAPLLDCWHEFTDRHIHDRYWRTRDQGTLVAAAWRLGQQGAPTLPRAFNFIVDPYRGVSLKDRPGLRARQMLYDDSYTLTGDVTQVRPFFLHFINGGML